MKKLIRTKPITKVERIDHPQIEIKDIKTAALSQVQSLAEEGDTIEEVDLGLGTDRKDVVVENMKKSKIKLDIPQ
jgi:S-adenosylmethionine hydrolase